MKKCWKWKMANSRLIKVYFILRNQFLLAECSDSLALQKKFINLHLYRPSLLEKWKMILKDTVTDFINCKTESFFLVLLLNEKYDTLSFLCLCVSSIFFSFFTVNLCKYNSIHSETRLRFQFLSPGFEFMTIYNCKVLQF